MKQKTPLTYEVPRPARETSRVWDFLAGGALIAPFLTVPVFTLGATFSQDYLITGDGLSWRRATLYFGVPTGAISAVGLVAAIRAVALSRPPRAAAIFAVATNALALGVILHGFATAPAP